MEQKTRIGAYGVVLAQEKILLTTKVKGPYRGLFDLPGGGIEFGESPEEALRRELKEEVCLTCSALHWLANLSHVLQVEENCQFHHLGFIYQVEGPAYDSTLQAEDPFDWYPLNVSLNSLTPFAQAIVKKIKKIEK